MAPLQYPETVAPATGDPKASTMVTVASAEVMFLLDVVWRAMSIPATCMEGCSTMSAMVTVMVFELSAVFASPATTEALAFRRWSPRVALTVSQ
ncbi:hypothetical protein BMS3Bbin07_00367 [bacterium BMS3Bbin07]|nr:hypothetical protein BMS3Bbin07_00367 [bacterium BMS3Bbin07]